MREIELLSPARDADTAIEAILHGADAVYIGPEGFGARKAAANSIDDIKRIVEFAHPFRAKVYATVNTVFRDKEAAFVERLITDLYRAGVDAIIVQDFGILRLDIPPVQLHASTQCHTDNLAKARLLQDLGFSQIVLARELTIEEIAEITAGLDVPVETFVHGALCVSYSGRCHISRAVCGRSANRGECAQFCRMPYNLTNGAGKTLERDKYLLSLKDFNASDRIGSLLGAGVSSYKIEGRLKDAAYVKNVTAAYRRIIDAEIARRPDLYRRSSFGTSEISFEPRLERSFNRGFTHYFLDTERPGPISSMLTPKSLGEPISDRRVLHNGDGISWFSPVTGEYTGVRVNKVVDGRIMSTRPQTRIPAGVQLYRTSDAENEKALAKPTATRRIGLDITLDASGISAKDERGVAVRIPLDAPVEKARKEADFKSVMGKLGATKYRLDNFTINLPEGLYIPPSVLTSHRRALVDALDRAAAATYPFAYRREEKTGLSLGIEKVDFRENVANKFAREVYKSLGVKEIEPALEAGDGTVKDGAVLMTCRHCILRDLGKCLKENPEPEYRPPLYITTGPNRFRLDFDCANCRMRVLSDGGK